MSTSAKVVTGIVVILAILAGIQYAGMPAQNGTEATTSANGDTLTNNEGSQAGTDASDESLDKDLLLLEAELKAASNDSSAVDSGLNDKPVDFES